MIAGPGDYVFIIERLETLTGGTLALTDIIDQVDIVGKQAWVEFTCAGRRIHWDAEVDDDWLDPYIVVKYDALLAEAGSAVRIYSNHTDYGQTAFFAAFTPEQKAGFDALCPIELILIAKQT